MMERKREDKSSAPGPSPDQAMADLEGMAPVTIYNQNSPVRSWLPGIFQAIQRWLVTNTFAPSWVPRRWNTPALGYLVALALQGLCATGTLLLLQAYPSFAFSGVLEVLVVALVALNWGAGPSLVATLIGALLLEFVILPPPFTWNATNAQSVVESLLFLAVGVIISIVASQSQRARKNAEHLTNSLAVERAHLDAIIEAIPDAVAIYDAQGTVIRLNHAGQQAANAANSKTTQEAGQPAGNLSTAAGERFQLAPFPLERVLRGETLEAVEVQIRSAGGQERFMSVSAAPLRDLQGRSTGAVSIMRDITTLRKSEQALREANRQMSDFLSLSGHELRTPLTGIIGHLQLARRRLERHIADDLKQATTHRVEETSRFVVMKEPLQRAEQQARLMNRLVGDLLDAARIQSDRLALYPTLCNLATIVQEVVEEHRWSAPERSIALGLPTEEQVPILADADRIKQALTNYLTNALKYSPEDQPIKVRLQLEQRQARVLVVDHGPGLPAYEHERIWERFHRVQGIEARSGSGVGLGLGLHISRSIIEQHRGRVGVESQPGQGATFWFTLPLARSEAGAPGLRRNSARDTSRNDASLTWHEAPPSI
jgi:signal transduction histidine kinase